VALRVYLVRTVDRNAGTAGWVKVQAEDFDDARMQAERLGFDPREIMLEQTGAEQPPAASDSTPPPPLPPSPTPPPSRPRPIHEFPTTARKALLVSAIANLFFAASYLIVGIFLCFPVLLACPLFVLAIFEMKYRAKLETGPLSNADVIAIRNLAILQILAIVLGNVPSLVCGLMILVNQHEFGPQGVSPTRSRTQ